ncbi:hypothetical protein L9G15_15985 [Shewanella sp. A3A]|nr:hypothetical protein [Shewanella ferrihydritica]
MAKNINLAISEEKLAKLILAGELCAADIKCLDKESKQAVWRLCLWCCAKRTSCEHCQKPCDFRDTDNTEALFSINLPSRE